MKTINELTKIDITSGINGYPEDVRIGYIGFNNIDEAIKFAEEVGGNVVLFKKRDGWHFWNNGGSKLEELTASDYVDDLGDNYHIASVADTKDTIRELLQTLEGEELIDALKKQIEILEELEKAEYDETVICGYGSYYETCKDKMMSYHEDVWTYEIGVEPARESTDSE